MLDLRGIPTCSCPECGETLFRALVSFDPNTYMVSSYHLDIECNNCGALATAPTPMDNPVNPNTDFGTKE
jgi:ribosomal protein S27E